MVLKKPTAAAQAGNPRNSERDFIQLKDGRIMFIYSYFTDGDNDHSEGQLAARFSHDGGKSWTKMTLR